MSSAAWRREESRDWLLIAILAVAAVARVGVVLALHDHPLLQPKPGLDSGVYLDLARRVAGGDLLCGDRVFFVSPFYVYFAAAVLALSGGSIFVLQLVQALLGVAAVWLVADAARTWFGQRGAWIAGALAGATGYFAFQESLVLQSAVDPFLTALGLWLFARAWTEPRWQRFLLAGVVLGLHGLNRPNMIVWAAAAVALTALPDGQRPAAAGPANQKVVGPAKPTRGRYKWAPAALLVAGLLLAFLPVVARNYAVAGQLAAASSHGGLNFYIGNNARADGTYRLVPGITPSIEGQADDMRRVAGEAAGRPMTDVEASGWFYRQATDWIRTHPVAAASLFARKIALVFNAEDIPLNDSYAYFATDEASPLRVLPVGPWLLLPLGLAGLVLPVIGLQPGASAAWRRWGAFIPVYALGVALFFVTGRYRLPILVACCVTAAGCVLALIDRARAGGWRRVAVPLAAIVALAAASHVKLGIDNGVAGSRGEMILRDIESGNVQAAEARLARTEPMYPNRSLLLYRVGRAYRQHGENARALAVFERARLAAPGRKELDREVGETILQMARTGQRDSALTALRAVRSPGALDPATQSALGQMALELDDAALAEPFLARSVQAAPDSAPAREAYALALAGLQRMPEATAALQEAARLDPANAGVRVNLAILYAQEGRFAEARRQAEEATRLRPDDPRAREFLASLPRGR